MAKAKVKVSVSDSKKRNGTLLATSRVAIARGKAPQGEKLYETRAQIGVHLYRGQRPATFRLKRSN